MTDVMTERDFATDPWGGITFAEASAAYARSIIAEARATGDLAPDPEITRKAKEYDALIASGALAALGINP